MTRTRIALATVAFASVACGDPRSGLVHHVAVDPIEGSAPAASTPTASMLPAYLHVTGTRDGVADATYPCVSHFEVCLPVASDGSVGAIEDLCPTLDTHEAGISGTGTWDFTYGLFTDPSCTTPMAVTCLPALDEVIGTGITVNNVQCTANSGAP